MAAQTGKKAPSFTLTNEAGEKRSLSDYSGKWLILYFYPKDNTPGCTREAIDFTELLSEFTNQGAVVVGISPDSQSSHQKFAAKHDLKVELLADPEHEALAAYGVWQEKNLYGKKAKGVVRTTVLIDPDGVVRNIWDNVKVENHAMTVMDTLCGLQ